MPIGKTLRRILGPLVFLFGLCLFVGYAWVLVTAQDVSLVKRLFGALFGTVIRAAFIFVGYDWMRGHVSMKFPKGRKNGSGDE
jgi:hypothetical protein